MLFSDTAINRAAKAAAVLLGAFLLAHLAASAAWCSGKIPTATDVDSLQGNWFERELLRLKSFPHLDRAYRLLSDGQRGEAAKELQIYLQMVPGDLRAQEMLVITLADEGRLDDALRQAGTVLAANEADMRLRLVRANLLARMGRDDAAAEDYSKLIDNPNSDADTMRQALLGLASIRQRQGQYSQVLQLLDRFPGQPDGVALPALRAQALLKLKRVPEAVRLLESSFAEAKSPKERLDLQLAWAQGLMDLGDLTGADRLLEAALKESPENPYALRALAENAVRRKEPERAVEYARRAEAAEATPEAKELYANALLMAGKPLEAAEVFRGLAANAKDPATRARLDIRLGNALALAGKDAEAAEAYKAAAKTGDGETAYEMLATSLERLGRFDEAIQALQKVVESSPTAVHILRLAGLKSKTGDPQQAADLVRQALDKGLTGGDRIAAEDELGVLYFQAGKDKEALEAWKAALAKRPNDPALLSRLAAVSQRMGDIQGAVGYAEAAYKAQPDLNNTSSLAVLLALSGQSGRAADLLRQTLPSVRKHTREEADLLERLANLEAMAGRHEQSAELFIQSFDSVPGANPALLSKSAGQYLAAGQTAQAGAVLSRLLRMPGLTPAVRAEALSQSAAVALRQGDMNLVVRYSREALETNALTKVQRGDTLMGMAAAEQKLGHNDEAVKLLDQALKEGVDPWRAHYSLGLALYETKRYDQALVNLKTALKIKSTPGLQLAIARCYESLNKPGLAIQAMLEVDPAKAGLSQPDRKDFYYALGNLYALIQENQNAADAYRRSLAIQYDPGAAIRLARMERLLGNPEQALKLLESVQAKDMPGLDLNARRSELPPQKKPSGKGEAKPSSQPPLRDPAAKSAAADPAPAPSAGSKAGAVPAQPSPDRQPIPLTQPPAQPSSAGGDKAADKAGGSQVLRGVEIKESGSGTVLLLKGVGGQVKASSKIYEGPARLVVDLPGSWRLQGPEDITGNGGIVRRVHIGQQPNKLRMVVTLADKPAPPVFEGTPDGLVVRLVK
ncbi:tetratricopeptide repeat protein [Fundidesulfovibrio soli]|uniref:tetratricopeptide repeat protein n=1 Tax=Fundidesulfovibrio soli TaxID=2922716 RepID=UPI001FAF75A2|nr:tetratricopeptide repeat protein [Fundidesulfovibrio soli]